MSVWSDGTFGCRPTFSLDGDLYSVAVCVGPRLVEPLLDLLARMRFPINPQIYHDAAVVYLLPDGRRRSTPTTLIEFPVYGCHLEEVRAELTRGGFDESSLLTRRMLERIHSSSEVEPAPPGAPYAGVIRCRHGTLPT